jgi:hypothetical protein
MTWCGFFLPGHQELLGGGEISIERWAWEFERSEDVWVLQTYLRLRAAGYPVGACDESDADGYDVVVVHPDRVATLRRSLPRRSGTAMVVAGADKTRGRKHADLVITQNVTDRLGRTHFVPHWPQPALVPREAGRSAFENVVFKGRRSTLHPELQTDDWAEGLSRLGLDWIVDDPTDMQRIGGQPHPWSNYSTVDVVVAIRRETNKLATKPATKLVNAWMAGCPAVLGVEPAFREMRCCELDYVEVRDASEALSAIKQLRDDSALRASMVAHGRMRAQAFGTDVMIGYWMTAINRARVEVSRRSQWKR